MKFAAYESGLIYQNMYIYIYYHNYKVHNQFALCSLQTFLSVS